MRSLQIIFTILTLVCVTDVWASPQSGEPQSPGVYSHEVVLPTPEPEVEELVEETGKTEVVKMQEPEKVKAPSEWPNSHVKYQYEVSYDRKCDSSYSKGIRFDRDGYRTDQCLHKSHLSVVYETYYKHKCEDGYFPGAIRKYQGYGNKKCYLSTNLPNIYEIHRDYSCRKDSHEKVQMTDDLQTFFYKCVANAELLGKIYFRYAWSDSNSDNPYCANGYTLGIKKYNKGNYWDECLHINSLGPLYVVDDDYKCASGYVDGRRYKHSDINRIVRECRKL